jgi:hypothetical protein
MGHCTNWTHYFNQIIKYSCFILVVCPTGHCLNWTQFLNQHHIVDLINRNFTGNKRLWIHSTLEGMHPSRYKHGLLHEMQAERNKLVQSTPLHLGNHTIVAFKTAHSLQPPSSPPTLSFGCCQLVLELHPLYSRISIWCYDRKSTMSSRHIYYHDRAKHQSNNTGSYIQTSDCPKHTKK